ncbi:MAG: NAD(P)H-dependent oxidoreductase subunit E [Chlamydiae bacterium]|nr:NAD(P)H-dependent oxidoreductase subunit E [Chlamydiota bacterium]MBI3267349.1 NAD(P)H-dependent oxidoreductase subunit E [Chlamydiota bacterium]
MQAKFQMSSELKTELDKIVSQYETKQAALLPVLNLAQEKYGSISPEIESWVADYLQLPLMKVREVVSFYTLFHAEQKGKHHFQMCRNMSCMLRGCEEMIEYLKERLKLEDGQTSQDRCFSLSTVECLAACEMAPMMQLNDRYVGPLTKESIDQILKEIEINN